MVLDKLHYDPPGGPVRVVHRDKDLLLVDKPSGLLSVPGKDMAHRLGGEARVVDNRDAQAGLECGHGGGAGIWS